MTASAPGKLFLTGEYAVLDGAPALVAAVDRYATVRVRIGVAGGHVVVDSLAEGTRHTLDIEAALPGGDAGAVLAALHGVGRRVPALARAGMEVAVDSRPFLNGGQKLGLGRSAATLTAAVGAFLAEGDHFERAEALEIAVAAHARFQQGQGSGADVAAALHGGLIEVRRGPGGLAVVPRTLPAGLELVVGWTGEGAATAPLLDRFASARGEKPAALAALASEAERAAAAVAAGNAPRLCAAVAASADLLARLGEATDLPIVTPGLARLVRTARRLGAAAKPSGAGGGDCGIALVESPAQAEALRAAWRAEGIVPLPLGLSARGVTVG